MGFVYSSPVPAWNRLVPMNMMRRYLERYRISETQVSDTSLKYLTGLASMTIYRIVRQFFSKQTLTLCYNGDNTTRIPLQYPLDLSTVDESNVIVEIYDGDEDAFVALAATQFKITECELIRVDETVMAVTAFTSGDQYADIMRNKFPTGDKNVKITAEFGRYIEVPAEIEKACKLLVLREIDPEAVDDGRAINVSSDGFNVAKEKDLQKPALTGILSVDRILIRYAYRTPVPKIRFLDVSGGRERSTDING